MVPSSTVFEMYPLGFLTIASYLHQQGMSVRIVNLALRMMNSRRFDVPAFLARQRPRAIGIDLHWLPHAHGALEVARIVKEAPPGRAGDLRRPVVQLLPRGAGRLSPGRLRAARRQHGAAAARAARRAAGRRPARPHCEPHLEGRRQDPRQSTHLRACLARLRGPAAGPGHRDDGAPPRLCESLAVPRLVAQPDRGRVHREGVRLRVRHLRQLAYHLHAPHQAPASRVPEPRKPRRQRRGLRPPHQGADRADRRSAHGGRGPRERGPREAAPQRRAQRDHHRAVRGAAAGLPARDRPLPAALEHRVQPGKPRPGGAQCAGGRGGLHDRGRWRRCCARRCGCAASVSTCSS